MITATATYNNATAYATAIASATAMPLLLLLLLQRLLLFTFVGSALRKQWETDEVHVVAKGIKDTTNFVMK